MSFLFKRLSIVLLCWFAPSAHATPPTLLVFGDSLSAGYGIAREQSWPVLLERRLHEEGKALTMANASISGETTAGGRARFERVLRQTKPAIVILALGANDGLRGLPLAAMRDNLATMIGQAKRQRAKILLVGMRLPPNYGEQYTREFTASFRILARREKVALLPFLLEPIALDANAFQADGLHPTAEAQPRLMQHMLDALSPLLR
ncbi:MAG: arylesterase [Betaproteobacteria bacterium HGW-Betaproteobacteria-11]|nr:MAG: arylesterase [Betaproteobacteria bacterium HGW-Betaproteobacteria-11]